MLFNCDCLVKQHHNMMHIHSKKLCLSHVCRTIAGDELFNLHTCTQCAHHMYKTTHAHRNTYAGNLTYTLLHYSITYEEIYFLQ